MTEYRRTELEPQRAWETMPAVHEVRNRHDDGGAATTREGRGDYRTEKARRRYRPVRNDLPVALYDPSARRRDPAVRARLDALWMRDQDDEALLQDLEGPGDGLLEVGVQPVLAAGARRAVRSRRVGEDRAAEPAVPHGAPQVPPRMGGKKMRPEDMILLRGVKRVRPEDMILLRGYMADRSLREN